MSKNINTDPEKPFFCNDYYFESSFFYNCYHLTYREFLAWRDFYDTLYIPSKHIL